MKKTEWFMLALIILSFIASIYFYPQLPDKVASHWDAQGQVNGYMSKFWGAFFMPLVILGIGLLFFAIPKIDPLKENIKKFRKYYDGFIILFLIFMLVVQLQMLLWNAGFQISPNILLPIGLGVLFFYVGILMENTKRNWFIGIRTPWTLSNETVWKKTHAIGGKLFKACGIISLLGVFFQKYSVLFIVIPIVAVAAFTFIYSYILYRKETKNS